MVIILPLKNNLIKKQQRNKSSVDPADNTCQEIPKYVSTEFGEKMPNVLNKELKKHHVTLAFKTSNKLEKHISINNKSNKGIGEKSGVYKISCDTCDSFYIGQTGRTFAKRFSEHLPKASNNFKSNFADHIVSKNHKYTDWNTNLQPFHICKKG